MSTIPKQQNIAGYWKGNLNQSGTLQDFSGNANHMTLVSAPPQVETPYGSALDYDGTNDYCKVADNTSLSITGDLTISTWLNTDNRAGDEKILTKWISGNTQNSYLFKFDAGKVLFFTPDSLTDGGNNFERTDSAILFDGIWHHITVVYDASVPKVIFYLDGRIQTSTTTGTIQGSLPNGTAETRIGSIDGSGGDYEGRYTQTILWNTALNPNDARQLYLAMQRLTAKRL
ncbi:hypothetical protein CL633_04575 [bacterium]|jgi:hypothetical protein|nr:hypothetical protein [bacterium]|tara:strand:+ start:10832 stop:11521 length:690 start_codon:yes stop_codon:yes gene_type:complete